jgi:hypothetical protein
MKIVMNTYPVGLLKYDASSRRTTADTIRGFLAPIADALSV